MVGLAFSFDLGRYHATPWGNNVNDAVIEWPPSEWRILRALYAVSHTNVRLHTQREAIDDALRGLAHAPPPRFKLPPSTAAHTRHYLPRRSWSPTAQGETDRVLDGFRVLDPEESVEAWWETTLSDSARAGLAAAANALGYLGRSESICSARLLGEDNAPSSFDAAPTDSPDSPISDAATDELIESLCVDDTNDPLSTVAVSVDELRRARRLQPPGTRFVSYALRTPPRFRNENRATIARPTLARYRLLGSGRPSLHEAVAATTALRGALQGLYGRRNNDDTSPVFSGRSGENPRRDQHAHAHYIATPGGDGRRVEHLTVWAPEGFGSEEVAALATLTKLSHWSFESSLPVVLTALGRPDTLALPELVGEATEWQSLTPFGLTRHPKRRGGKTVDDVEEQIQREWTLRHPDQADLLVEIKLWHTDRWRQFRRTRPGISRLEAPRVTGAKLRFTEPVQGPIALGALSHFGLGLFVPESP
jgi:CRISPR-associated protein Csb2